LDSYIGELRGELFGSLAVPEEPPAALSSVVDNTAIISNRCQGESAIQGAYFQSCMADSRRDFNWPATGNLVIEQGSIGPSATGEALWNAAHLLSDYLATKLGPDYFRGKRVIELGCGTALPSIVAAKLGAASVVATDIAPEVVARARRNVELNKAGVQVQELAWGNSIADEDIAGSFDVVLASDVLWVLGTWRPFSLTVRDLLSPRGTLMLAETGHDQLALPAALANFRNVAEGAGLAFDDSIPLPYQVGGFDAQVVRAHVR